MLVVKQKGTTLQVHLIKENNFHTLLFGLFHPEFSQVEALPCSNLVFMHAYTRLGDRYLFCLGAGGRKHFQLIFLAVEEEEILALLSGLQSYSQSDQSGTKT